MGLYSPDFSKFTGYRKRLSRMNDTELEKEWRNRCDMLLRYKALKDQHSECWFEAERRGLAERFRGIYEAMKAEHGKEEQDQLKGFWEKFGVKK